MTTVPRTAPLRLRKLPPRESVERLRERLAANKEPKQPPPKRRSSRRRKEIPAEASQIKAARQLALKRIRLERQLREVHLARLQALVDLRAAGVSLLEVSEILGITKGRVQQMEKEAAQEGIVPSAGTT